MSYQSYLPGFPSYVPLDNFDRLLTCLNNMDNSNGYGTPKLDIFREARVIVATMEQEADPKAWFYIQLLRGIYAKGVCARTESYFSQDSICKEYTQLVLDF
ncbi:MAG TPA: hypothetical protein VJB05_01980 [archaeon]|nr:hypothetical protein [archaeon]